MISVGRLKTVKIFNVVRHVVREYRAQTSYLDPFQTGDTQPISDVHFRMIIVTQWGEFRHEKVVPPVIRGCVLLNVGEFHKLINGMKSHEKPSCS